MSEGKIKISKTAKAANIVGLITLMVYVFFICFVYGIQYFVVRFTSILLLASITFILGVWAFMLIRRGNGELGGFYLAIFAILEGLILLTIGCFDLISAIKILSGC